MADLHKRILGTLGSVFRSSSIEREIAERQIILKDYKSKSWFVYVNSILSQYKLPSTLDLLSTEFQKTRGNRLLTTKSMHIGWTK